jgi:hypothetical protein
MFEEKIIIFSAFYAKAMYHKEIQCKKEDVQKFLSSIIAKPPGEPLFKRKKSIIFF